MFDRYSYDEDDQYFSFLQMEAERFERYLKEGGAFFMDSSMIGELFYYYKSKGLWSQAEALIEYALEIYPYQSEFYFYQSQIALKKKNFLEAFKWADRAIEMNPSYPSSWLIAVEALLNMKQKAKAVSYIKAGAETIDAEKKKDYYWRAGVLLKNHKQYNLAHVYLLKAFYLDPKDPDLVYELCELYEKQKKPQLAITIIEKYLEHNPEDCDLWYELGTYYEQKGWYDHAIRAYRFAYLLDADFDEALQKQAECYYRLGDYDKALHLLEDLDERPGKKPTIYYELLGKVNFALGRYKQASQAFYQTLKRNNGNQGEALAGLVKICLLQKDYERALELLATHGNFESNDSWETLDLLFQMNLELQKVGKEFDYNIHQLLYLSLDEEKWSYWIHQLFLGKKVTEAMQLLDEVLPYFDMKSSLLLYQKAAYLLYTKQIQKGFEVLENALLLDFKRRHVLYHFVPMLQKNQLLKDIIETYRIKTTK